MEKQFNEDGLLYSEHYEETMNGTVLPFLQARQTDETVRGFEDRPLFTSRFQADDPMHGTVFIVHGFTENAVKYSELIFSLLQNGFNVLAYDQRGHGRSWRDEKVKDVSVTHVKSFNEYEKDLFCICRAMEGKLPKPWRIFCHSMGGAVSALFLQRHPDVFERAAFCAPMIAINRRGFPFFLMKLIMRTFIAAGKGCQCVFISKPYNGREHFEGACATGRERFEWYSGVKDSHEAFHNNCASYSWILEALKVSQWLLAPGAAKKIACPVNVYSAEDDWEVLVNAQKMFVKKLRQGQIRCIPGSRHEIYRSTDEVLFPWWREVLSFLKDRKSVV